MFEEVTRMPKGKKAKPVKKSSKKNVCEFC